MSRTPRTSGSDILRIVCVSSHPWCRDRCDSASSLRCLCSSLLSSLLLLSDEDSCWYLLSLLSSLHLAPQHFLTPFVDSLGQYTHQWVLRGTSVPFPPSTYLYVVVFGVIINAACEMINETHNSRRYSHTCIKAWQQAMLHRAGSNWKETNWALFSGQTINYIESFRSVLLSEHL